MMEIYQIVVITLVLLAIADLVVGVSNDAVNFLNSAIGSRVAGMNTILIIAAAGVLMGALSSSGMMEIARKGIFHPEVFSFKEVMAIFVAVMVADILLLDVFNSLGLPTSTTVSIVFNLLGAAVAVAIWKSVDATGGVAGVAEAINFSTATAIILGIFLSIGVAFTIGAVVQYLCRLWFSFRIDRYLHTSGVWFAGVALTIIVYFLLIKGAKGSALLNDASSDFIDVNTWPIIGITLIVSVLLIFLLVRYMRLHPLKVVVFGGTFALAMAFAGNDLVNFIGVPLAGYQSFLFWSGSGVAPDSFMMGELGEAVRTPFLFLFIAGAIMVVTLWFSGKARKVTETEVNLSRQSSGEERFKPNFLSRSIVGGALALGGLISRTLPDTLVRRMNIRFHQRIVEISEEDRPAFDLLRAAVNLIVASLLIALATSKKLPLSTTYVSFMVAMGTSLADKAWGTESAVYRVAGVLNVIGGWLITALGAFFTAGVLATGIYYGGPIVAIILGLGILAFFISSNLRFNKQEKIEAKLRAEETDPQKQAKLFQVMRTDIITLMHIENEIVNSTYKYLKKETPKAATKTLKKVKRFEKEASKILKIIYKSVLKKSTHSGEYGVALLYNHHHVKDLSDNLQRLIHLIYEHEKNHQSLPEEKYMRSTLKTQESIHRYQQAVIEKMESGKLLNIDDLLHQKRETQQILTRVLNELMIYSSQRKISHKQAIILSEFLLQLQNLNSIKLRLLQNYQRGRNAEGTIMDALI